MVGYPTPRLVATASEVVPGRRLPLQVRLDNPGTEALRGASAELTLEVERGVLVTWDLTLTDVPAGGSCHDALARAYPAFELPANVPAGNGRFTLVLRAADGSYLDEDRLELAVRA